MMVKKKIDENEIITEEISFESKIEEAKKYLDKLIDPEITLSGSVEAYKKGMEEIEIAQKLLDNAKLEYEEIISKDPF
jgi:exodeoxyribonuclease VII small subunit